MARGGKKTNNTNVATEEVANKVVEEVKEEIVTVEETVEKVQKVEEETQTVEDSVGAVDETVTEETTSLLEDDVTVSDSDENKEEALEGVECDELPEKEDKNPKAEEQPRLKHKVRYYEEVYGCNWNGQCFDY